MFSNPLFNRGIQEIPVRKHFFIYIYAQILFAYWIDISTPPWSMGYWHRLICKQENSQKAGRHRALSIRQKIPEIPGEKRMERTFSGISSRNFRCTSRACPNVPENRNTVTGKFCSIRLFLLGPVSPRPKLSTWLPQCSNVPNPEKRRFVL